MKSRMRTMLVLQAMLLLSMGLQAANTVHLSSVSGSPGTTVTVSVSLDNSDAVSALQVKIPMPQDCSLSEGSAKGSQRVSGHSVTAGVKEDTLNLMIYSTSMAALSGNSGEVMTFDLVLGAEPVTDSLRVAKVILTNVDGSRLAATGTGGALTILAARAEVSTRSIDFGHIPIRNRYTQDLTISNTGNIPLTITGLKFSVPELSSSVSLPLSIEAGGSSTLPIIYVPTKRGAIEASLSVESNSATRLGLVTIVAQPFAVNELHIKDASGISDSIVTVHLLMNNMDAINGFQMEFNLPEQLSYVDGSFTLSDRKKDHVVVANLSGTTLKAVCYSPTNTAFTGEDGEIATFQVVLTGQSDVSLEASKVILSADIDGKTQDVLSDKVGGYIRILAPYIYSDYSEQDFDMGASPITEDARKELTIYNGGTADLTISRVVFSNEKLSVEESLPITIAPGQNKVLNVVYKGTETGDYTGTMQLYNNTPSQRLYQVNIKGNRYSPNFLSTTCEAIAPGDTATVAFQLDNHDAISGIQFDLSYDTSNFAIAGEAEEARANGISIAHRTLDSGAERYFCYFLDNASIAQGSGKILKIYLKADSAIACGTYQVNISNVKLGTDSLDNVNATSNFATDIFVEMPVSVHAVDVTRVYGDDNPEFTCTSEGATLSGTPEMTCEATKESPIGTYPIEIKKGSVTNHNVTYIKGTLTITKAPLTVSAGDYTKKQGDPMPDFKAIYEGFKNGETEEVLTKKPVITTTATKASVPGNYPVTISGAEAQNYDISYQQGTLTVTYTLGDVNADGEITIKDIIVASNYILGESPSPFIFAAADINSDNEITINDLIGISNIILENTDASEEATSDEQNTSGEFSVTPFELSAGNTQAVAVDMTNSLPVLGYQFDLSLPEGVALQGISMGESRANAKSSNIFNYAKLSNGSYRVLCASVNHQALKGTEGTVINLELATDKDIPEGNYDMTVSNVEIAGKHYAVKQSRFTVPFQIGAPTFINKLGVDANTIVNVYNTHGIMIRANVKACDCLKDLPKGIYIINGKKIVK